jgi:hypothetical protein
MNTRVKKIKPKQKPGARTKGTRTQKKKTGFDATKYFGKLVRGLDGLTYQRMARYEWS